MNSLPRLGDFRRARRRPAPFFLAALVVALVLTSVFGWGMPRALRRPAEYVSQAGAEGTLWIERWAADARGVLSSKASLVRDNRALRERLREMELSVAVADAWRSDYRRLKNFVEGVSVPEPVLLARVLAKPGKTPYGTLVLSRGVRDGVAEGDAVVVGGDILLGEVVSVSERTSRVSLFSAPGRKSDILLGEVGLPVSAEGQGGGMWRVELPHDADVALGSPALLHGNPSLLLGVVGAVDADSAHSIKTILFHSPVNIAELVFVEIRPRASVFPPEF